MRNLVGVPGFEPGTSSLSGTRSNQLSYTPDEALTPLSKHIKNISINTFFAFQKMLVEAKGFEPLTFSLQS